MRYFQGGLWSEEDIINRLKETDIKKAAEKLQERLEGRKITEKKLREFSKKIQREEYEKICQMRDMIFLRTRRSEFVDMAASNILPLLYKINEKLGLTYKDMLYCSPLEIVNCLRNKGVPSNFRKLIKERQKECIVFTDGVNDSYAISGNEAKVYVNSHPNLILKASNLGFAKGSVAYLGITKGIVRIVKCNADLSKVCKGDILVAPMTLPSFVPAMERAAAFVTDEGGITCHAAIVSREMKKPCITGTKNATKVFEDGDFVEVNANKGTVKVLKGD